MHSHLQQTHLNPDLSEAKQHSDLSTYFDYEDEVAEQFYKQLDSIIEKTPERVPNKATEMPKWALTHTNTGQGQQEN